MDEYIKPHENRLYNVELRVGQKYKNIATSQIATITELDDDPHWLCAVILDIDRNNCGQPFEYFLKNWKLIKGKQSDEC